MQEYKCMMHKYTKMPAKIWQRTQTQEFQESLYS